MIIIHNLSLNKLDAGMSVLSAVICYHVSTFRKIPCL